MAQNVDIPEDVKGAGGTIYSPSPSHGPATGGNSVRLTGIGLGDTQKVFYGGQNEGTVDAIDSDGAYVDTTPPKGAPGQTVLVFVRNSNGLASNTVNYTYDVG
jgi:hypothetical protein